MDTLHANSAIVDSLAETVVNSTNTSNTDRARLSHGNAKDCSRDRPPLRGTSANSTRQRTADGFASPTAECPGARKRAIAMSQKLTIRSTCHARNAQPRVAPTLWYASSVRSSPWLTRLTLSKLPSVQ